MKPATGTSSETDADQPRKLRRVLQVVGAVLATAFALWFLFGIPGYVLFNSFFT